MDLILRLLSEMLYGVIWGAVLLVVSLIVLPERVQHAILHKIKPDLTSRSAITLRLRLVLDYLFNRKDVILEDHAAGASADLQVEIAALMREKRVLEGNLFFLDLLKNLSGMLVFSAANAGYSQTTACEFLDQSMEYLQYYARQLAPSATAPNIEERVDLAAQRLRDQSMDVVRFLKEPEGEERAITARLTMRQGASAFDAFMKAEYESTRTGLIRINQLLADKFMAYIGHAK